MKRTMTKIVGSSATVYRAPLPFEIQLGADHIKLGTVACEEDPRVVFVSDGGWWSPDFETRWLLKEWLDERGIKGPIAGWDPKSADCRKPEPEKPVEYCEEAHMLFSLSTEEFNEWHAKKSAENKKLQREYDLTMLNKKHVK